MNHRIIAKLRNIASDLCTKLCSEVARQAAYEIDVIATHEERILQKEKLRHIRAKERREHAKYLESRKKI